MSESMSRPPSHSRVVMTQLVLPGDANTLGNAFGGKILQWIDIAAGVAARRHADGVSVTASIDSVQFIRPVKLGDVVTLVANVTRAWTTSMEIVVIATCDETPGRPSHDAITAFLTFVALDDHGHPRAVPALEPTSKQERNAYEQADRRRAQRLAERQRCAGDC
jgi:acyl-CoA hydrolase